MFVKYLNDFFNFTPKVDTSIKTRFVGLKKFFNPSCIRKYQPQKVLFFVWENERFKVGAAQRLERGSGGRVAQAKIKVSIDVSAGRFLKDHV